ncbi:MAG: hypothetical protein KBS40_01360 [Bacteroidales bacterium]|nr:hypothetical protein [Bacteroidales bacterium]
MEEMTITLTGTGNAGKEAYKELLNQMFTRAESQRGGSKLLHVTNLYAQCITLQRAIDETLKDREASIIELFLDAGKPVGERCDLGEECFTVSDKKDFNYSGNDDDGLYSAKMQQINVNKAEGKVLTAELNAIKKRIEFEHPNMHVEHNYNLMYNGYYPEVHANVVVTPEAR